MQDALGDRIWVESEPAKAFVQNILTAFDNAEKTYPAIAPRRSDGSQQQQAPMDDGSLVEDTAGRVMRRYLPIEQNESLRVMVVAMVRDHLLRIANSSAANTGTPLLTAASPVKDIAAGTVSANTGGNVMLQSRERESPRNAIKVLQLLAASVPEARAFGAHCVDAWLNHPTLARFARDLLTSIVTNCTTNQDQVAAQSIFSIKPTSASVSKMLIETYRPLIENHSKFPSIAIQVGFHFELQYAIHSEELLRSMAPATTMSSAMLEKQQLIQLQASTSLQLVGTALQCMNRTGERILAPLMYQRLAAACKLDAGIHNDELHNLAAVASWEELRSAFRLLIRRLTKLLAANTFNAIEFMRAMLVEVTERLSERNTTEVDLSPASASATRQRIVSAVIDLLALIQYTVSQPAADVFLQMPSWNATALLLGAAGMGTSNAAQAVLALHEHGLPTLHCVSVMQSELVRWLCSTTTRVVQLPSTWVKQEAGSADEKPPTPLNSFLANCVQRALLLLPVEQYIPSTTGPACLLQPALVQSQQTSSQLQLQPQSLLQDDNIDRKCFQLVASASYVHEETLFWVVRLTSSPAEATLTQFEVLDILEKLVTRGGTLQQRVLSQYLRALPGVQQQHTASTAIATAPGLGLLIASSQAAALVDQILLLTLHPLPREARLPAQLQSVRFANTGSFWRASVLLVIMASLNMPTFGRLVWSELPTLRCLMEMLLTKSFRFPAVSSAAAAGPASSAGMLAAEQGILTTETAAVLQLEAALFDDTHVRAETSRLLRRVMLFDVRGVARQPPADTVQTLAQLGADLQVSSLLCLCRSPDVIVDVMARSSPAQVHEWLRPMLQSHEVQLVMLPTKCLCELFAAEPMPSVAQARQQQQQQQQQPQQPHPVAPKSTALAFQAAVSDPNAWLDPWTGSSGEDSVSLLTRAEVASLSFDSSTTLQSMATAFSANGWYHARLLSHLQSLILDSAGAAFQNTMDIVDFFLKRLSSASVQQRHSALCGIALLVQGAAAMPRSPSAAAVLPTTALGGVAQGLLERLPSLPQFGLLRPLIWDAIRNALGVESTVDVMCQLLAFLIRWMETGDSARLALTLCSALSSRPALLETMLARSPETVSSVLGPVLQQCFVPDLHVKSLQSQSQPHPSSPASIRSALVNGIAVQRHPYAGQAMSASLVAWRTSNEAWVVMPLAVAEVGIAMLATTDASSLADATQKEVMERLETTILATDNRHQLHPINLALTRDVGSDDDDNDDASPLGVLLRGKAVCTIVLSSSNARLLDVLLGRATLADALRLLVMPNVSAMAVSRLLAVCEAASSASLDHALDALDVSRFSSSHALLDNTSSSSNNTNGATDMVIDDDDKPAERPLSAQSFGHRHAREAAIDALFAALDCVAAQGANVPHPRFESWLLSHQQQSSAPSSSNKATHGTTMVVDAPDNLNGLAAASSTAANEVVDEVMTAVASPGAFALRGKTRTTVDDAVSGPTVADLLQAVQQARSRRDHPSKVRILDVAVKVAAACRSHQRLFSPDELPALLNGMPDIVSSLSVDAKATGTLESIVSSVLLAFLSVATPAHRATALSEVATQLLAILQAATAATQTTTTAARKMTALVAFSGMVAEVLGLLDVDLRRAQLALVAPASGTLVSKARQLMPAAFIHEITTSSLHNTSWDAVLTLTHQLLRSAGRHAWPPAAILEYALATTRHPRLWKFGTGAERGVAHIFTQTILFDSDHAVALARLTCDVAGSCLSTAHSTMRLADAHAFASSHLQRYLPLIAYAARGADGEIVLPTLSAVLSALERISSNRQGRVADHHVLAARALLALLYFALPLEFVRARGDAPLAATNAFVLEVIRTCPVGLMPQTSSLDGQLHRLLTALVHPRLSFSNRARMMLQQQQFQQVHSDSTASEDAADGPAAEAEAAAGNFFEQPPSSAQAALAFASCCTFARRVPLLMQRAIQATLIPHLRGLCQVGSVDDLLARRGPRLLSHALSLVTLLSPLGDHYTDLAFQRGASSVAAAPIGVQVLDIVMNCAMLNAAVDSIESKDASLQSGPARLSGRGDVRLLGIVRTLAESLQGWMTDGEANLWSSGLMDRYSALVNLSEAFCTCQELAAVVRALSQIREGSAETVVVAGTALQQALDCISSATAALHDAGHNQSVPILELGPALLDALAAIDQSSVDHATLLEPIVPELLSLVTRSSELLGGATSHDRDVVLTPRLFACRLLLRFVRHSPASMTSQMVTRHFAQLLAGERGPIVDDLIQDVAAISAEFIALDSDSSDLMLALLHHPSSNSRSIQRAFGLLGL
ncbi:hypothetical protein CAOG_06170 [Capsaspora owczarzaki ATCC 30864]|nr:hypothetical protein CAOG_06170 [Capsaspora owczarzaki ATCC 30864]|eukprot:XP_004345760.2 hypothetical protein CAOG_06170 [Capsaspora owczarzaki ATCC 30864]